MSGYTRPPPQAQYPPAPVFTKSLVTKTIRKKNGKRN